MKQRLHVRFKKNKVNRLEFYSPTRPNRGVSGLDRLYPVFCGAVISAFISVFVFFPRLSVFLPATEIGPVVAEAPLRSAQKGEQPRPLLTSVQAGQQERFSLVSAPEHPDLIREDWQDLNRRDMVLAFFAEITQSEYLASCVLVNAEVFDIPPSLAFALCWEESRFNARAVNKFNRDESIDRGLFQLNNKSFPNLQEEQFYDVWLNAYYGMAHLRLCLDKGGSTVAGLAMYNAGTVRVTTGGGAPKQTLDYVSRIFTTIEKIDRLYLDHGPSLTFTEDPILAAEEIPLSPRLALLGPALRMGTRE
jgi:hypothetical protein